MAAMRDGHMRVGPLVHLPRLLRDLDQDPETLLWEAGIDPRLLDDRDEPIDFAVLGRILAHCASSTGCEHFGLLLGQRCGLADLGLLGLVLGHAPHVEGALRDLVRHLPVQDRGLVGTLVVEGDRAFLAFGICQPGVVGVRQIYDLALTMGSNLMKELCGRCWGPIEVWLPHREPARLGPFHRFFRAPLRFSTERAALVFPIGSLQQPLRGADPILYGRLRGRSRALESRDLGAEVRMALRHLLLDGQGSLDQVARRFGMHRRTLNRRLRGCGLTFRALQEETRSDIARQLLRETDLPLVDIAVILGYAEASAFTRAFRSWAGAAPSAWRAEHRPIPCSDRAVSSQFLFCAWD
jgi:AraC-like DNA-binding protein